MAIKGGVVVVVVVEGGWLGGLWWRWPVADRGWLRWWDGEEIEFSSVEEVVFFHLGNLGEEGVK